MSTDLFIRNPRQNEGLLGGCQHTRRMASRRERHLPGCPYPRKDIAKSHVCGYIYPYKPPVRSTCKSKPTAPTRSSSTTTCRASPRINGRASGTRIFYGKFKALTMEGRVCGDILPQVDKISALTFSWKTAYLSNRADLLSRNNRIFDTQASGQSQRLPALPAFQGFGIPLPVRCGQYAGYEHQRIIRLPSTAHRVYGHR